MLLPLFGFGQHHMMHVLASQGAGGTTLKTGLLSVWEFDETSGTTAYDAHASNDGTTFGATVNQTGKINKAYDYTEGTTDKVSISDPFYGLTSFSVSVWFKVDDVSGTKGIVSDWDSPYRSVLFRLSDASIQFYTYTGTQVGGTFASISAATWYHVVITYDGSDMEMYINNSLDGTSFSQTGTIGETGTHTSYIGNYVTSSFTTLSFDGLIDQVAIWNRALTSTEVSTLYNSSNGLTYTSW